MEISRGICIRLVNLTRNSCEKCTYTRRNAQVVTSLFTSCRQLVFALLVHSLEQAVNNLYQAWWNYQTCYKVVLTSLIQSWYNKNVTRLTTQGCNNTVISWLYRTCWNNIVTGLIISTRLLQIVHSLFQTCWQLGTSSANTTCWRLVGRLATRCEIFTRVGGCHCTEISSSTFIHLLDVSWSYFEPNITPHLELNAVQNNSTGS
jgi:hypothetical protein